MNGKRKEREQCAGEAAATDAERNPPPPKQQDDELDERALDEVLRDCPL